ncbi:ATP-binding protein [Amycolatopsis sp. NPDC059027]|uniref:AAA family ATPase n=1 Tax=unclassified Amycolatopsis TaxID=2618356 RepID=UPI00366FFD5F
MTSTDWEAANAWFLSASLTWLRLLLIQHSEPQQGETTPDVVAPKEPPRRRLFGRHDEPAPALPAPATPRERVTADQLAAAADAVRQAEASNPPPALVALAERLELTRFERDTLLLCAAVELDPPIAALCAAAQGNPAMTYPTFGLAMSLLPGAAWEVVSPHRGLRYWRLIELTGRTAQGVVGSPLRVDERIVNYLKGLNHLDDRLAPLVSRLDPAVGTALPPSQQAVVDEIGRHWHAAGPRPVVQLAGADEQGKRLVAAHAALSRGMIVQRLSATLLPTAPTELDELARLWQREAQLLPLALYLDVEDGGAVDDAGQTHASVTRFLGRISCPTVFAARESWSELGRQSLVLDVEPPTPAERVVAWRSVLGPSASQAEIDSLAAQFALEVPAILDVAAVSGGDAAEAWRVCRARTRPRMDSLAQRLEPKVGWEDIVLPPDGLALLRRIAEQVPQRAKVYDAWGFGDRITRGLGVSVLFAGPSGVGKTMAAEVLARQLRLDLYRIDLSAVVSKYIGETEKNLRRLFDAAEGGGAILLFDEADALFGKRTEVKDSHDRYANIEINFLLQRMEAYCGLAILATNMRGALDGAFLRRLRFIVDFSFPGTAERKEIWLRAFPEKAPREDLDFDRLAQLQTSGGMTRNIALNAAFLAAARGSGITMPIVLDAARAEFEKLELPTRARDFAWEATS